jgi:hypothetical protein
MSTTPLQTIVESIKQPFLDARAADKLTFAWVLRTATTLVKQVYAFEGLSDTEKKAIVLLALQQALAAAGPLQGFSHVDPAIVAELQNQALYLVVASVVELVDSFPQVFAEIHTALSSVREFLSKYLPFCSQVAVAAWVVDPRDSELITQALEALHKVSGTPLQVRTVAPTQVVQSATRVDAPQTVAAPVNVQDTPLQKTSDMEPSLEAVHPTPQL